MSQPFSGINEHALERVTARTLTGFDIANPSLTCFAERMSSSCPGFGGWKPGYPKCTLQLLIESLITEVHTQICSAMYRREPGGRLAFVYWQAIVCFILLFNHGSRSLGRSSVSLRVAFKAVGWTRQGWVKLSGEVGQPISPCATI